MPPRRYLESRWVRVGLWLLAIGAGPLLVLLAVDALLGVPDPNPVGPGLLCGLLFWPAVICLGVGVVRVRRGAP